MVTPSSPPSAGLGQCGRGGVFTAEHGAVRLQASAVVDVGVGEVHLSAVGADQLDLALGCG